MKIENKVFVITGAGSGIGRYLSLQLLEKKAKVSAIDINQYSLNETKKMAGSKAENLSIHVADISNKEIIESLPEQILKYHGQIDAIINNAGIIQPFIDFKDLSYENMNNIFNVNFWGTIYMIKTFLPHLLNRPEAYIINVSSMGGFIPFPGQSIYSASKAAVKLLTEALYTELKKTNVRVTLVLPGAIDTNIVKNSGVEIPSISNQKYSFKPLSPEIAVREIIKAIEKEKFRICIGKDSKFIDILYRLNPLLAIKTIMKAMSKK